MLDSDTEQNCDPWKCKAEQDSTKDDTISKTLYVLYRFLIVLFKYIALCICVHQVLFLMGGSRVNTVL